MPSVDGERVGCRDTPPSGTGGPSEFVAIEPAGVGGGVKPVSSTGSSTDEVGLGDVIWPGAEGDDVGASLPEEGWPAPECDGDTVRWVGGLLWAVPGTGAGEGA